MKRRSLICMLLVLCMLIQPFLPVLARQVEGTDASGGGGSNYMSGDIDDSQAEFDKAYETVMSMEEIDLEGFASACVGAVSFGENVGIFFGNVWDNITNGGNNQQEYVDYLADIEEANAQIREAKAQMQEMKEKMDAGDVDAAKNADPSAVAGETIEAQSQAMSTLRDSMTKAGNTLIDIGNLCDTVSTILGVLDLILKGVCLIPVCAPAIPILEPISEICGIASTALGIAGPLMTAAGESLVESAEMGYTSDAQILGNLAIDVGTEGVKQAACQVVAKGCGAVMDDLAGCLVDSFGGNVDDLIGSFVDEFDDDLADIAEDFATGVYDEMVGQLADAVGMSDLEEAIDDGIGNALDTVGDTMKDNTVRPTANSSAGLNVGDDDDGFTSSGGRRFSGGGGKF